MPDFGLTILLGFVVLGFVCWRVARRRTDGYVSIFSGEMSLWEPFDNGGTIGQEGSENGTIISDEEHLRGARITLERTTPTAPFAITCGVYGWMVHTRFVSTEAEAIAQFEG